MSLEDGGEEEQLLSHNTQCLDPTATASSTSSSSGTRPDSDDDVPAELQDLKSNAILLAQGHKSAMQRSFSPLAALSFGFSITNSWVGYLSCFGQNLAYAGPNSVVFGLLVAAALQWIITLGLSEIAACFPSSGGQYHFVFILAPKKHRKFAAFLVGWMNILGWSVALCSGVSVVVASISGLIAFWNDAYQATQWQSFLIYLAVAVLSLAPLFLSPRLIPTIVQIGVAFSVTGLVLVFYLVLALRKQSRPLSYVMSSFHGTSGWSIWPAWVLGVTNSMYAFSATDAVIHVAEEMKNPERRLPQALNVTMMIGFVTAFPLFLLMMLSVADVDAVLKSRLPYAELFYQITGSKTITTLMACWVTVALFFSVIGEWVTCGRLTWAFSRDRGLPYSAYFSHVSERFRFPVRATLLTLAFCSFYGLLYLVSTTAFNSIITSAVLYLNITCAIPQALVAVRGRKNVLPEHAFDLGWVGYLCNYLSPLLVFVVGILVCLPPELPVTQQNINYTPVVLVGLSLAVLGYWYVAGSEFEGPKIDWDVLKNIKII
ncbi:choline transport protein [Physcia stellaris]|nr:choline transport protein [Physcia stellaris]